MRQAAGPFGLEAEGGRATRDSLEQVHADVRECGLCPLGESRTHAVPGEGPAGAEVFFVGEAPVEKEDLEGRPFVGNAGRVFNSLLPLAGLRREEVYVTGVVKCRPPGNRKPRASEMKACKGYLERQLDLVNPKVVVLLGGLAVADLLGGDRRLADIHGVPVKRGGTYYFPTYHPASAFYRDQLKSAMEEDMRRLGRFLAEMDIH